MVKKINTIYSGCIKKPWLKVVDHLYNELNINPSYFIGWEADNSAVITKKYKDCYYQNIGDAWKGIGFPKISMKYFLNEQLIAKYAFEELIALRMMDRLDGDNHSFPFVARQQFYHYLLNIWLNIIDELKINLVISPAIPHRIFDYALYVAANIRDVRFIMFQQIHMKDSSFIIDDINQTPDYLKRLVNDEEEPDTNGLRDYIKQRIDTVKTSYDCAIPEHMINQEKTLKLSKNKFLLISKIARILRNPFRLFRELDTYVVKKGCSPSGSHYSLFELLYIKSRNIYKLKHLQKCYNTLLADKINKKYILIALHYQPEETTCPTGGAFVDQIMIVQMLNNFLGEEYDIVVKEHKTQFHPDYEGVSGRTELYYHQLNNISDRVKFVPVIRDPFELIDNATAVITVSGAIGWESVIRGTPALIFGRAWYEDMAGVYKIKSLQDLKDAWPRVIAMKNNIRNDQIISFHIKLQTFLIEACHYKTYIDKTDRSMQESASNIVTGIKQYFEYTKFV